MNDYAAGDSKSDERPEYKLGQKRKRLDVLPATPNKVEEESYKRTKRTKKS